MKLETVQVMWEEYWKEYVENNPDADGTDYHYEREAFFEEFGY